ncbi:acyltransferase family protein [Streptomyces sp. NPDC002845]
MRDTARPAADRTRDGQTQTGRPPPRATPSTTGTPTESAAPKGPNGPNSPNGEDKRRDAFFDNAKYLAIVLVGLGHAWAPLYSGSRTAAALYMAVYAFHMPAFIVISGYFSRGFDASPGRIRRLVTGVAVPYVVFETAYALFKRWAVDDPAHPVSLIDPGYLTWFLVALFVWRLTTPLWQTVRRPLSIALVIAALASLSPDIGGNLDLQRVLQFLPFFVLGLRLKPEHFQLVRRREVRLLSPLVFAMTLIVAYWAVPRMNAAWFFHRDSAQELGAPAWAGPVMTLFLFGCSLLLTACFFAWVPRHRTWFTALGTGTLYGYLLHGFVAKGSRFWGWYDHDWIHTPFGEIAVTVLAAALITALCTSPVRRIFRFVMEPKMEWSFRRDPAELVRGRL